MATRLHLRRVLRRVLETAFEKALRRILRRGLKKRLSRRHLEGRNTPFQEYDPLRVRPTLGAKLPLTPAKSLPNSFDHCFMR